MVQRLMHALATARAEAEGNAFISPGNGCFGTFGHVRRTPGRFQAIRAQAVNSVAFRGIWTAPQPANCLAPGFGAQVKLDPAMLRRC
jgi:hypothetical protein